MPPDAPAKPTKPAQPRKAASATPARKRAAPSKGGAAASDKTLQAGKSAIRGAHNPEKPRSTRGPATKKPAVVAQSGEHRPVTPKAAGSKPADRATITRLLSSKGVSDPDAPLTAEIEVFITEYLRNGLNGTAAYLKDHPEATPGSAAVSAHRWLRLAKVRDRIADERRRIAQRHEITRDGLLRELLDIVRADPNELMQMRHVSCDRCWGGEERPGLYREPDPECETCLGEGLAQPWIADTRKLSPEALALFAGIQKTKDGIKILVHSKLDAYDKIAKIIGAYEADNSQKASSVADALRGFFGGLHSGAGRLPIAQPEPGTAGTGTRNPLVNG